MAWGIFPGLARPESLGEVRLTGSDPEDAIGIHANHPADSRDVRGP